MICRCFRSGLSRTRGVELKPRADICMILSYVAQNMRRYDWILLPLVDVLRGIVGSDAINMRTVALRIEPDGLVLGSLSVADPVCHAFSPLSTA
jgi:hypothetical protein